MTRRDWIRIAAAAAAPSSASGRLDVPVHRIWDARERCPQEQADRFRSSLWPEAVRDFSHGGIDLRASEGPGEVKRTAADRPVFIGLLPHTINLVLTGHIPLYWDNGRALPGVSTIFEGYHVCLIALPYAHADRVPFLSVNTCVHELLHALLGDLFLSRPSGLSSGGREFRVDWYATRLWLSLDSGEVRDSAAHYLERLRSA